MFIEIFLIERNTHVQVNDYCLFIQYEKKKKRIISFAYGHG